MTQQVQKGKKTKKQKALELFQANLNAPRQTIIDLFVKNLDMTENSARTHLNACLRQLAPTLNLDYKTRKRKPGKFDKALQIFNSNPNLSRAEMIDKFVQELKMSRNSAATQCSKCAKMYNGNNKHSSIV